MGGAPSKEVQDRATLPRDASSLFDLADDLVLMIYANLVGCCELAWLQTVSRRFAKKTCGGGDDRWTLSQEAARIWLASRPEHQRAWAPRRGLEPWLDVCREVASLLARPRFARAHEEITLSDGGHVATKTTYKNGLGCTAAGASILRAGRHFAEFTVLKGGGSYGIVRPDWCVRTQRRASGCPDHCFYNASHGTRRPGNARWDGMRRAVDDDRVGLLLDLEEGSLTVFLNDARLGAITTGLTGHYCWAVVLMRKDRSARLDRRESQDPCGVVIEADALGAVRVRIEPVARLRARPTRRSPPP